MSFGTVLLIILILLLLGALPTWPYSAGWGYYPFSGLGLIVLVIVVLLLTGRISRMGISRCLVSRDQKRESAF
jgi:hypothetical protein